MSSTNTTTPRTYHVQTLSAGQTPGAGSLTLPCWCALGHNHEGTR